MVKYSIVIPTYNRCEELLKPCIESILQFTDTYNIEVIVVANGCIDNTFDYVMSLGAPFKLIWADSALGYTKATNLGIKEAIGKFVVLLNNDTLLLSQNKNAWLELLENPFNDPNVGITGPLELFDEYSNNHVMIFFCVMIRRDLFDKIGLLDEVFSPGGGEDIDFTIRANNAGYKSIVLEPTVFNIESSTNVANFPIWHKSNKTFGEIPEYASHIIKRNGLINCKRYNKNIKLNLGAGGIEVPGYLSVDLNDVRANIHMDITQLDFETNSITEILASHVFEHLNPYKSIDILANWLRVLKPGGKLIMEMPDIEKLCKAFTEADTALRYGLLNAIYGSVNTTNIGDPSDITSPHLFGWWPQSIYDHLNNAGYVDIKIMDEQIPHPGYNFRVEAIKPLSKSRFLDHNELKQQDIQVYNELFELNNYNVYDNEIEGKTVIDIGANIGMFSLLCLEKGAEKILAIEAQPTLFNNGLLKNTKPFSKIIPLNFAVFNYNNGVVYLENNQASSVVSQLGEPVKTITLKTLLEEYNIEGDNLVLKMDCEGSEFNIIMTSDFKTMRKFDTIYIELHGNTNPDIKYKDIILVEQQLINYGFSQVYTNRQLRSDENGNMVIPMDVYVQKWKKV
jgi:FkbM family methyltransferase